MRSVRFAELLLSLVTTESRASVMAGDLIEESETRSRFWRAVLQTFAAQVWRGIVTNPWAMMRGAMLATLMQFVYFLPLLLAILLLSAGLGYLAGRGLANIPAWFMPAVGLIGGTALFPLVRATLRRRRGPASDRLCCSAGDHRLHFFSDVVERAGCVTYVAGDFRSIHASDFPGSRLVAIQQWRRSGPCVANSSRNCCSLSSPAAIGLLRCWAIWSKISAGPGDFGFM